MGSLETSVLGTASIYHAGPYLGPQGVQPHAGSWGSGKCKREWDRKSTAPGLTQTLLQTSVSLKRIQHFLNQDEFDPQCVERKTITPGPDTLTWAALATAPAPVNPHPKLLTFLLGPLYFFLFSHL